MENNMNVTEVTNETKVDSAFNEETHGDANVTGLTEDDPLSDENLRAAAAIVKKCRDTASIIQDIWAGTKEMYHLTNEHMNALWVFNKNHVTPRTAAESPEEWDEFNGILKLTSADAIEIFGKDHEFAKSLAMTGVIDIILSSFKDFINFVRFTHELQEADRGYRTLLELREENDMLKLKNVADNESDPEKKKVLMDSLDKVLSIKYLDYLRDPLPEKDIQRLVDAFGDEKTIDYWIKRSVKKLEQLRLTSKTILEISGFETICLPERYHKLSNMTLTYFMMSVTFADVAPNGNSKTKEESDRIVSMIIALDNVIRKVGSMDTINRIKGNVMAFLDQLIEPVYKRYYPDDAIPELSDSIINGSDIKVEEGNNK